MSKTLVTAILLAAWLPALAGGAAKPPHGHAAGGHAATVQVIHNKIKALQAECDKDPKAWEPRAQLGQLCLQFGLTKIALKRLGEAIALKPDHAPLYHVAGQAHLQLKQYDKAIALWQKALELTPDDKRTASLIQEAEAARKDEARLAELEAALKKSPTDVEALLERARIRARRGQWKDALADLDALLNARPDHADAFPLAAMAHYRLGHLDEAVGLWERAVKANPKDPSSKMWLAEASKRKLAVDRLDVLTKQLRISPADAKLQREAGELYARLGKWRAAVVHLREAVRLAPKDAAARKTYGLALVRIGRMDEAVAELETCVKLEPKNPDYPRLLETIKRTRDMHRDLRKRGPGVPGHGR